MDTHTEEKFLERIQQKEIVEYEDCPTYNPLFNGIVLSILLLFFLIALTLTTCDFLDHSNLPEGAAIDAELDRPTAQYPESEQGESEPEAKTVLEATEEADSDKGNVSSLNKDICSDSELRCDCESGDEQPMSDNETYYTPNTKLHKSKPYYYTLDELRQCNGSKPNGRILLAVNKNVYDVSRSERFYAPGQPCSIFAGNNVESKTWENVIKSKYNCVGKLLLTAEEESETPTYRDLQFERRMRTLSAHMPQKQTAVHELEEYNDLTYMPEENLNSDKLDDFDETEA